MLCLQNHFENQKKCIYRHIKRISRQIGIFVYIFLIYIKGPEGELHYFFFQFKVIFRPLVKNVKLYDFIFINFIIYSLLSAAFIK